MTGPRDSSIRFGVPVDVVTGKELTPHLMARLDSLNQAVEALYRAMHECEGSTSPEGPNPEHRFGSRRMSIANTHIETAMLYARAAIMETG